MISDPVQILHALADAISTARHRLTSLIAHPATQLPDIAAELAQLANSHDAADCEQRMGAGLHRLLSRSSAAFKVMHLRVHIVAV